MAISFDDVFLLVAFHYIALVCNYCFFLLWLIKYLSIYAVHATQPKTIITGDLVVNSR